MNAKQHALIAAVSGANALTLAHGTMLEGLDRAEREKKALRIERDPLVERTETLMQLQALAKRLALHAGVSEAEAAHCVRQVHSRCGAETFTPAMEKQLTAKLYHAFHTSGNRLDALSLHPNRAARRRSQFGHPQRCKRGKR